MPPIKNAATIGRAPLGTYSTLTCPWDIFPLGSTRNFPSIPISGSTHSSLHSVILSEARGFALRIRMRSRKIPTLSSASRCLCVSSPIKAGQDREGHEYLAARHPARVERTLLSAALDLDPDLDFDLAGARSDSCATVEERRFTAAADLKGRDFQSRRKTEVRSNHPVILSEACGFALRIRMRSRRIPAPSSVPQPRQGVLPVPPCSQTMRPGRARVPLVPHQRPTRNAASAAEVRASQNRHPGWSRRTSDRSVKGPASGNRSRTRAA